MRERNAAQKTDECLKQAQGGVNSARDKFIREQVAKNEPPTASDLRKIEGLLASIVKTGQFPHDRVNSPSSMETFALMVPIAMQEVRKAFVGFQPVKPKKIGF